MVQLSDFVDLITGGNVAKRQTKIYSGEAHMLWEHLQQRHDYLELTLVCLNNITDFEFKKMVEKGLRDTMKTQIQKVEDLLTIFGIPFPEGAPQSIKTKGDPEIWRDEMVFNLLLVGIRNFMNVHLRGIKLFLNDGLRNLFMEFLVEELKVHDNMMKYGKLKGWVLAPPAYGHQT
ncbi:MAG: DUF3231 family protein [Desulfotomaculaceae bacterium]